MSSACQDKEAAWEFMRQILTKKYNYNELDELRLQTTIKTVRASF